MNFLAIAIIFFFGGAKMQKNHIFSVDYIKKIKFEIVTILLFLTGGITNPFVIFLLIPSVFSSSNLSLKTNTLIVLLTIMVIIFLSFYSHDLPKPISDHFHVSQYYLYSFPLNNYSPLQSFLLCLRNRQKHLPYRQFGSKFLVLLSHNDL